MSGTLRIFIPGTSPLHRADARVKLVLLLALSIAVFFVEAWAGIGILAAFVALCVASARLPIARLGALSAPVLVVLAIVWLFNAFVADVSAPTASSSLSGVSAGFAAGWQPIALAGTFGFSPEGCMRGLFYAARIMIILVASFAVTFTTAAEALTDAFSSLLRPLRRLRVPVDDVALMLSLAVRFIPLMAEEAFRLQQAQRSRGADFAEKGIAHRLASWQTVLIPLVVRMFRRATTLGEAMEARCYGAGPRTALSERALSPADAAALVFGLALCVALAVMW